MRAAALTGIEIPEALVPLAIDEFPVLFIAAACAEGRTVLRGAQELRVKESDRIQVMADGLLALGVKCEATPDGLIIDGGPMAGVRFMPMGTIALPWPLVWLGCGRLRRFISMTAPMLLRLFRIFLHCVPKSASVLPKRLNCEYQSTGDNHRRAKRFG